MHIDSFAESVSNIGEAFDSFNEMMEDFEKIYVKMLTNVSNRKLKTTLCTIYNPCFEHNDMERLTYMLPPNPNIKKLQKRSVTALPIFNNIIFQEAPQVAGFFVCGMMGRIVSNLVSSQQNAGYKSIQWNATNNIGQPVSAGLYLYTIQASKFRHTKKMVLLK